MSLEEELARAKSNTAFPMYVAKLTREVDESINWCEVFGTDDGLAEIEDFVEFMAATYRQKRRGVRGKRAHHGIRACSEVG